MPIIPLDNPDHAFKNQLIRSLLGRINLELVDR